MSRPVDPPVLVAAQQAKLKAAVQEPPGDAGVELANWNLKGVRQYVKEQFDCWHSSRSGLNYLHRLGFVLKWPKKRLLKDDAAKCATFVQAYVALRQEAQALDAKIFFVDEAHFRVEVEWCANWVLRGQPALVVSTSPGMGENATYYSAVCLETGEVDTMTVLGNRDA